MLISLDIETKCNLGCSHICEHGLYPHQSKITVIGIVTEDGYTKTFRDLVDFNRWLTQELSLENPTFLGQNLKFDIKHLKFHGIDIPIKSWAHDTQLMAFVLTEKIPEQWLAEYEVKRTAANKLLPTGYSHRRAGQYSLKTLAPYFLGIEPFWEDPTNHDNDEYVLKDCKYTLDLYDALRKRLEARNEYGFYETRQMPFARELLKAEIEGIKIDMIEMERLEKSTALSAELSAKKLEELWAPARKAKRAQDIAAIAKAYDNMTDNAVKRLKNPTQDKIAHTHVRYGKLKDYAISKVEYLNIESPAQILWVLQDYYGVNCLNSDGGKPATNKKILTELANDGRQDAALLLEFKKSAKRKNAYFPAYRDLMYKGKLHCSFNATGARTGRISSSDPNLQQVPGDLKRLFVCEEDDILITRDVAALEPTLIAFYSNDQKLCELLLNNEDFHSTNAKHIFNLDCEVAEVKTFHKPIRDAAKEFGLSVLYGAGAKRVMESLKKRGFFFSETECRAFVKSLRDLYKGAWQFKWELDKVLDNGETICNYLGRPIRFENKEEIYMKGFNRLIQGSGSDIILASAERINASGIAKCLLFVHDELVVKVKKSDEKEATEVVERELTSWNLDTAYGALKFKVEGNNERFWSK